MSVADFSLPAWLNVNNTDLMPRAAVQGAEAGQAIAQGIRAKQELEQRLDQQKQVESQKAKIFATQQSALADYKRDIQAGMKPAEALAKNPDIFIGNPQGLATAISADDKNRMTAEHNAKMEAFKVDTEKRLTAKDKDIETEKEKFRVLRETLGGESPGQKILNNVNTMLKDASALRSEGKDDEATKMEEDAALLKATMSENRNAMSAEVGTDDQGRPIVRMGIGGKPLAGNATVGMATEAQKRAVRYENAYDLISDLQKNLRPEDVGVRGVVGNQIMDKTAAQINPSFEDPIRVKNRANLGILSESLMREISDNNRFSNKDREDIGAIVKGTGANNSFPEIMDRLQTAKDMIQDRSRNYAERIGESIPLRYQTPDELRDGLKKQKEATTKAVQSGRLKPDKAAAQIKEFTDKTVKVLKDNYGYLDK